MKKMKALKAYKIVDSDGYNYPVTKATLLLLLQEHDDFNYSTPQELDRAEARDIGRRQVDHCWILTDRDVWHLNPFYKGEMEPHPEDNSMKDAK